MSGSRVALVAEDLRFAAAVGAHLEASLGHAPLLCRFDSVRDHLDRDTNGLLLLAAARPGVTVLLTGETGTGKTFLARLMHDCSARRDEPFVVVPCGAMPPNLIESAFFGHVRGAFTGADRARDGKFTAAGRGTILLDE